ncbi:MAG: hypothetical protein RLZZ299_1622 [Pseudomonadota bacterium]
MRRAAALAGGLAIALALMEGAARWAGPPPGPAAVPLLRGGLTAPGEHRLRTSEFDVTVHVNADGFVDRDWHGTSASDVAGPRRVMLIGDSFVQAAQVPLEAGWGRRLEQAAGDAGGAAVEVRSLGVPGAGTATALELLSRYGPAYRPDVVLLAFLVANDVLNNHPLLEEKDDKPFYTLQAGRLVRTDALTRASVLPRWLARSAAATWGWRAWNARRRVAAKVAHGRGMPIDLRVHDPASSPVWEEAWAVSEALVAAMSGRARAMGARFGVLLVPDGPMSNDRDRDRATARWPAAAGWDFGAAQRRAQAMAGRHAPTCDLLPALHGSPESYFALDGHWTTEGHARAARATAACLAAWQRERPD